MSYAEFDEFDGLMLEESRIIRIIGSDTSLKFEAEIALLADHPLYRIPPAGEIHCFAQVRMTASGQVTWISDARTERVTDDDGLRHLGTFTRCEVVDSVWHLEGPWGSVEVRDASWRVNAR